MNYIKTIALALAISTGACAVQATPTPPQSISKLRLLAVCVKFGMGAYLTHKTTNILSFHSLRWAAEKLQDAADSMKDTNFIAKFVSRFELDKKVSKNREAYL